MPQRPAGQLPRFFHLQPELRIETGRIPICTRPKRGQSLPPAECPCGVEWHTVQPPPSVFIRKQTPGAGNGPDVVHKYSSGPLPANRCRRGAVGRGCQSGRPARPDGRGRSPGGHSWRAPPAATQFTRKTSSLGRVHSRRLHSATRRLRTPLRSYVWPPHRCPGVSW